MNKLLDLYSELLELQRLAREGINIDDMKVESVMQPIRQMHDRGIDNNPFLDNEQKGTICQSGKRDEKIWETGP